MKYLDGIGMPALISIGGMRDSFEIDSGMRDSVTVEPVTFWKLNKVGSVLRFWKWRDGGMKSKLVAGCGI